MKVRCRINPGGTPIGDDGRGKGIEISMTSTQAEEAASIVMAPAESTPETIETLDLTELETVPEVEGNPVLDRFWVAIKRLPKYLKLAANLARDNQVPVTSKAALVVGGLYTISPIDLVPGIIPVAGQLDDLAVLLFTIRTAIRSCPADVAARHLERAGIAAEDFDADLDSVRETVFWLGTKGYRVSRKFAIRGGNQITRLWKTHVRPASVN